MFASKYKTNFNSFSETFTRFMLTKNSNIGRQRDQKDRVNGACFPCLQEIMSCQAQLVEVCQLKQKLEEMLKQRERELTALKGALKEEVATHDKEIEALREQYSADMEKLRSSMEQVSQVHKLS